MLTTFASIVFDRDRLRIVPNAYSLSGCDLKNWTSSPRIAFCLPLGQLSVPGANTGNPLCLQRLINAAGDPIDPWRSVRRVRPVRRRGPRQRGVAAWTSTHPGSSTASRCASTASTWSRSSMPSSTGAFPAGPTARRGPGRSARGLGRARAHLGSHARARRGDAGRHRRRLGRRRVVVRADAAAPGPRHGHLAAPGVLEIEQPFHPLGLGYVRPEDDGSGASVSTATTPPYAEVLEARDGQSRWCATSSRR